MNCGQRLRSTVRSLGLRALWALIGVGYTVAAYAAVMSLSWTPPLQNTDGTPLTDLASYRVYWRCGAGSGYPQSVLIPAPASSHELTSLPDGLTCRAAVTAINAGGTESVFSNEVTKEFDPVPVADPTTGPVVSWSEAAVAVERTGTRSVVGNTANASSANVTVPADATLAVIFWHGYQGGAAVNMTSISLGGAAATILQNAGAGGDLWLAGVGYVKNPGAGTQSLAWDWSGSTAMQAAVFQVVYLKGEAASGFIGDSDINQSDVFGSETLSVSLTTEATDLVIGAVASLNVVEDPTGAPTGAGQTVFADNDENGVVGVDLAQENAPAAGTTTFSGTGTLVSVVAVAIKAAAGGGGGVVVNPLSGRGGAAARPLVH